MTPLAFFLRTLWKTSAIFLGVTLVFVNPLHWTLPQQAVTAQKSPKQAAIDGLIAALNDRDRSVRRTAASSLEYIGGATANPVLAALREDQAREVSDLTRDLGAPEPAARTRAACELRELGSQAAPAIPALVRLLADGAPVDPAVCQLQWWRNNELTSPGEQAASALVAIGSRSFDPLLGALKSAAWIARRNAAWALGALDDRRAVGALVGALKDSESPVRGHAAWALGAIDDRAAVEALVAALKDVDEGVRSQVAWALGAIGDAAAVPGLLDALRDASAKVRSQAAWALGAIDDARAVDGLVGALRDSSATVRKQAAWALGAIGDPRAVSGLLPVLKDEDAGVRRQAAWAIGSIGR